MTVRKEIYTTEEELKSPISCAQARDWVRKRLDDVSLVKDIPSSVAAHIGGASSCDCLNWFSQVYGGAAESID